VGWFVVVRALFGCWFVYVWGLWVLGRVFRGDGPGVQPHRLALLLAVLWCVLCVVAVWRCGTFLGPVLR
jgi:hypothetical protein